VLALITQLDNDGRAFMLDLYKNYYNFTRKTIFNITHENEDIEDLINEVFIKLIEKVPLLRTFDCSKTTSYIAYTIRSVSINYLKHRKVENKHAYYCEDSDFIDNLVVFDDKS